MNLDNIEYTKDDKDFYLIIKKLSLSKEEIIENRFLIKQVYDERKKNKKNNIIPILITGTDGTLYKSYVVSKTGLMKQYISNIKSQHITKMNLTLRIKRYCR